MTSQSTSRGSRGWPGQTLVLALLLACLTACGGGRQPDANPSSPATSDSSPTSPSPTESSTTGEPSVQPATGPVLEVNFARLNVPEGFRKGMDNSLLVTALDTDTESALSLSQHPVNVPGSPRDLARNWLSTAGYPKDPKILAPITLDGWEVFHISGPTGPAIHVDAYGGVFRGEFVVMEFHLERAIPAAERQALIESVLASFEWL